MTNEEVARIKYNEFGRRPSSIFTELRIFDNLNYTAEYSILTEGRERNLEFKISGELPTQIKVLIKEICESKYLAKETNFEIEPDGYISAGAYYEICFKNNYAVSGYLTFKIRSNIYGLNSREEKTSYGNEKLKNFWFSKTELIQEWLTKLHEPFKELITKGIYSFEINLS